VAGYGMAGARLAEEIRRRDPAGDRVRLTVLGAERHPPYNRVLLPGVLAGSLPAHGTRLQDADWGAEHAVDVRLGRAVVAIDRTGRRVRLDDSATLRYDALVLATGARARVPETDGLLDGGGELAPGVVTFRTVDDCERIVSAARSGAQVAVLGGGPLGLETARGLAARGSRVTVVHPAGHLMERQLDRGAGQVLASTLRRLGIELRLGVPAGRYLPGDGLKLEDGGHVPAQLLVVSAGVLPETGLATAAGLAVGRGVLVDSALRTSDANIYAIGDCAQHPGAVSGLVQPAWDQAEVLADLLTGADPAASYRGTRTVMRLKARDVDLAALGEVRPAVDDPGAEVLCLTDPARGRYAKLVVRAGLVAGAIVLGLPDAAATIAQFYDRGLPVPGDRLALLLGRAMPSSTGPVAPADLPPCAVVCWCNSVTKAQLVAAWRRGAAGVAELTTATRATTGCGGCRHAVVGIAESLSKQERNRFR